MMQEQYRYQLSSRFPSKTSCIAGLNIGTDLGTKYHKIAIQSMLDTPTQDVTASVKQCIELFEAGADLVRITVPGPKDVEALANIINKLRTTGYQQGIVADTHFSPKIAMSALDYADKVRINPGNFVDTKRFISKSYTEAQYQSELVRVKESFSPLVTKAKQLNRCLRIGVNHGSLSDRIMNRYGDTIEGMVESAMEFLQVAVDLDFHNIVVSMKSANTQVMIQAYRWLIQRFYQEGQQMYFPLHLGLTEAGGGIDGRTKSALAIGTLLNEGIGDTIRVSLTEDPVAEIAIAKQILANIVAKSTPGKLSAELSTAKYFSLVSPYSYERVKSNNIQLKTSNSSINVGATAPHACLLSLPSELSQQKLSQAEWQSLLDTLVAKALTGLVIELEQLAKLPPALQLALAKQSNLAVLAHVSGQLSYAEISRQIKAYSTWLKSMVISIDLLAITKDIPLRAKLKELLQQLEQDAYSIILQLHYNDTDDLTKLPDFRRACQIFKQDIYRPKAQIISLAMPDTVYLTTYYRILYEYLAEQEVTLILRAKYDQLNQAYIQAAIQLMALAIDGIGDGIYLDVVQSSNILELLNLELDLLQASRLRLSKTEYISCPSCGRTQFDLAKTTEHIRKHTAELTGVKIAVMGCIVNGPGEMADADFGYVGAGVDKVHLYKGKELQKANIPSENAAQELVELIKASD